MACPNPVPKLYKSVIEDVIERVRNLFAEEGVEEQVLKDLKQLWETKILQSKATEDFFRNSVQAPLFTLQLPPSLHRTMQPSTASFVIPAGGTLPTVTTMHLGTSSSGANLTFPGYPIHVPRGMTLQAASGHLYKVPVMMTPERGNVLQHSIQQVFPLGQAPLIPAAVSRLPPGLLQAATEKSRGMKMCRPAPVLYPGMVRGECLERGSSGKGPKVVAGAMLNPAASSGYLGFPGDVFPLKATRTGAKGNPVGMTPRGPRVPLCAGRQTPLGQRIAEVQPQVLGNGVLTCDSAKQSGTFEKNSGLPESKDLNAQKNLNVQVDDDDTNEIIQIDGAGDTSSNDEMDRKKNLDESEFLEAGELKILEEEAESTSDEESTASSSDNEDPQLNIVEEDPLNSGDDVSEQDVPDLFDTDNVIVCQYDKIQRNKNKWKFYLKDGVMSFGGRDYVFSKAIGDAEW
ncbi:TFIIA-alpha and beta-like factor [Suncus etruscus]|uniref:TFIIA-alpha and beta-like factor n=1 Tax=Suncus etruscus TaxID=109475 RepID=UPI00211050C1|nr:TFIIA-alpha and beta-like factor [Suncus etruscus]